MQKKLNNDELIDISTISVDRNLVERERIADFLRQIKDPYHFKCKDIKITSIHPTVGPSIENCLKIIMA